MLCVRIIKLKNHIYKIYKTEMFEKNVVEQLFGVINRSSNLTLTHSIFSILHNVYPFFIS